MAQQAAQVSELLDAAGVEHERRCGVKFVRRMHLSVLFVGVEVLQRYEVANKSKNARKLVILCFNHSSCFVFGSCCCLSSFFFFFSKKMLCVWALVEFSQGSC